MAPEEIDAIFSIFYKNNPKPKIELEYVNDFTLLAAVILSAQSTDKGVNKATKALFEKYKTPEDFIKLGQEGLKNYVKTIGLTNNKTKNIIATAKLIVEHHSSKVPATLEELEKLPGVGRKTANVILNTLFEKPTMPVDTHIIRVSGRLDLVQSQNPYVIEKRLLEIIPIKWLPFAHHWLVLHGRYICKARKPECHRCPITNYCKYYKEQIVGLK